MALLRIPPCAGKQTKIMEEQQESINQGNELTSPVHATAEQAAPERPLYKNLVAEIMAIQKMRPAIIAIDGPAGAGKSTIGHELAHVLDFLFFDTGIMYRAVTWAALEQTLDLQNAALMGELARTIEINVVPVAESEKQLLAAGTYCYVHIDGIEVTAQLRTPIVERSVSIVSAHAEVREALCAQQRRIGLHYGLGAAEKRGIVMAGRDIGTVVLPDAPLKIYMVASLAERARRRFCEQRKKGKAITLSQVLNEIEKRDELDSKRALSPLRPAADAIEVDTSEMDTAEVLETLLTLAADQILVE
jgi:CMP/dCMP kinase